MIQPTTLGGAFGHAAPPSASGANLASSKSSPLLTGAVFDPGAWASSLAAGATAGAEAARVPASSLLVPLDDGLASSGAPASAWRGPLPSSVRPAQEAHLSGDQGQQHTMQHHGQQLLVQHQQHAHTQQAQQAQQQQQQQQQQQLEQAQQQLLLQLQLQQLQLQLDSVNTGVFSADARGIEGADVFAAMMTQALTGGVVSGIADGVGGGSGGGSGGNIGVSGARLGHGGVEARRGSGSSGWSGGGNGGVESRSSSMDETSVRAATPGGAGSAQAHWPHAPPSPLAFASEFSTQLHQIQQLQAITQLQQLQAAPGLDSGIALGQSPSLAALQHQFSGTSLSAVGPQAAVASLPAPAPFAMPDVAARWAASDSVASSAGAREDDDGGDDGVLLEAMLLRN